MEISVQELKEKMDKGENIFVIDVREAHEYEEANIGSELIPLGDLPAKMDDLEEHKSQEVIVMCRTGNRSSMAQYLLKEAGFANVLNLKGGIVAWAEASYPLNS
jgi:rhodanese-related sulfurtransferase